MTDFQAEEYGEDSDEDIDMDADGVLGALMEAIGIRELSELDKAYKARGEFAEKDKDTREPQGSPPSVAPTPTTTAATATATAPAPEAAIPRPTSTNGGSRAADAEAGEATMARIMDAMDLELSATPIGKSFVHCSPEADSDASDGEDNGNSLETMPDVNVDLNLVENIVQSFHAQEGLPGPAGTMLGQFGVYLPPDGSDSDSDGHSGSGTR
ncbi:hypothetical protein LPJ75_003971 [Coemansia sp. RSA 2598]|nr:hypothetical protein LPJ75_003971 [Coemansia sp. RSA 2598]